MPRSLRILVALLALAAAAPAWAAEPVPIKVPPLVVERIPFDIEIQSEEYAHVPYALMIVGDDEAVFTHRGIIPSTVRNVRVPNGGSFEIVLTTAGQTWEQPFRSLPGWLTLLPPLFAILVALLFRQVHVALFAGIWLGAFVVKDYQPLTGFFYVIDHYVIDALAGASGWDHSSILVFTLMLGGLVGVVVANGGASGIVKSVSRLATTPVRGQIAAWLMGIFIFFDDYTNTLIVGNTMRPLTDRLRISREKLSYIVDSTAAPVAAIAVVTSWVGFQISLLKDAFESVGMLDRNPLATFVASIPYAYYPILTLLFVALVAALGRDFGPMLHAERRARSGGGVLRPGATPLSNIDTDIRSSVQVPERWFNAVVPVLVVVVGTVFGLVATGRTALAAQGGEATGVFEALRAGNSFVALLWSSLAGCVVAILLTLAQRILTLTQTINAWAAGVKAMTPAIVILVLAWAIGAVCDDLHTADYLVSRVSGVLAPETLPAIVFLVAAAVSFSTGTSWGTMTILTPLCIPLVVQITHLHEIVGPGAEGILLASVAAILSGAVFGDHCSPISDTTIMSSMASTSDHIDHVRTQLPYAVTVAAIGLAAGYLPTALGLPPLLTLLLGGGVVFAVVRGFGRRVEPAA
ncbi:MAG: Na+/H+ antiporter NhaC family protein [Candidatus Krumholzibacteria bacterium]|nr:Na+/H+ antiporter NhaC family protein [Candidatus Krumholzibacteria bacterium]